MSNPEVDRHVRPAQGYVAIIADQPPLDPVCETGFITDVGIDLDGNMVGDRVRFVGTAKEIHYMGKIITKYQNVVGVIQDEQQT